MMESVYTINVDYFEEYCLKTAVKMFISLYRDGATDLRRRSLNCLTQF